MKSPEEVMEAVRSKWRPDPTAGLTLGEGEDFLRRLAAVDVPSLLYESVRVINQQFTKVAGKYEAFLKKATGRAFKFKRPALSTGPNSVQFKFSAAKKMPGELVPAGFFITISYDTANDLYDVETGYHDGSAQTLWTQRFNGVFAEKLLDPGAFFDRASEQKQIPKPKVTGEQLDTRALALLSETFGAPVDPYEIGEASGGGDVDEHFLRLAGIQPSGFFNEFNSEPFEESNQYQRVLADPKRDPESLGTARYDIVYAPKSKKGGVMMKRVTGIAGTDSLQDAKKIRAKWLKRYSLDPTEIFIFDYKTQRDVETESVSPLSHERQLAGIEAPWYIQERREREQGVNETSELDEKTQGEEHKEMLQQAWITMKKAGKSKPSYGSKDNPQAKALLPDYAEHAAHAETLEKGKPARLTNLSWLALARKYKVNAAFGKRWEAGRKAAVAELEAAKAKKGPSPSPAPKPSPKATKGGDAPKAPESSFEPPKTVDAWFVHMAAALLDQGKSLEDAVKLTIAGGKRYGYYSSGMQLTQRGKDKAREKLKQPNNDERKKSYFNAVKAWKKAQHEEVELEARSKRAPFAPTQLKNPERKKMTRALRRKVHMLRKDLKSDPEAPGLVDEPGDVKGWKQAGSRSREQRWLGDYEPSGPASDMPQKMQKFTRK